MTDAEARDILQMLRDNGLKAGKDPRCSYGFIEMDWGVISLDGDGVFHDVPMASTVGTPEREAEKRAWKEATERLAQAALVPPMRLPVGTAIVGGVE